MPVIKEFKALLYNLDLRKNLNKLLSPPYDVISPKQFEDLKALDSFQSVRLALTEDPQDPERYEKISQTLKSWKEKGVLVHHPRPAFYLVEDQFQSEGAEKIRIGFIALLKVSAFDKKEVLPHEHTLSGPKKDRLELLKATHLETSQIFLCYKDPQLLVEQIYKKLSLGAPLMEAIDSTHVRRRMWSIEDAKDIESIKHLLAKMPVLIADGHHRYETAVGISSEHPYAQVYFTNLNSPGFSIHPIHRVFSLPETLSHEVFLEKLAQKFHIEELQDAPSTELLQTHRKTHSLGLIASVQETNKHYLLSRKRLNADDAEIFAIHRDIFEGILGWNIGQLAKGVITYEHETPAYLSSLRSMRRGIGLFLPATDLELVMRLAERGERMPQKSTFFFPKLASGLINFDLDHYE